MDPKGVVSRPQVLHEVRAACRRVSAAAASVRIDDDAVARLAAELKETAAAGLGVRAPQPGPGFGVQATQAGPGAADPWALDDGGCDEDRAALTLVLATVNFGSGYHPHLHKRPGCSGATTIATAVRAWAAAEPLTAARLTSVTATELHERFGQPPDGGPRSELMARFATALGELGREVDGTYGGSFLDLVVAADGYAAELVVLLDRLPTFRDVAWYAPPGPGGPAGWSVPFYKRAQLAAADLDRAFAGRSPAAFGDLDDLTAFADNLVPHVLRVEGVLGYDPGLGARIDAGEPVPAGSADEIEIRAGGVEAVERLRAALERLGVTARSSDLDTLLWRRGGTPRFKAIPRHRTRSGFY
jgi:hypothetical protein